MDKNIILLLTATIKPNSFDTLVLIDPNVRREQYIESLTYYLHTTNFKIVFVENSGESLSNYFFQYIHRIEFLTYDSKFEIIDRGKGFKEVEIINFAMENSSFISGSDIIIKITGRLNILNINRLSKWFIQSNRFQKNMVACNIYKTSKMDSRCFIFTKNFWCFMQLRGIKIDLKYSFESALWDAVKDYVTQNKYAFKQLPEPLRIKGISGGFGNSYYDTYFIYIIKKIKHKMLLPFKRLS